MGLTCLNLTNTKNFVITALSDPVLETFDVLMKTWRKHKNSLKNVYYGPKWLKMFKQSITKKTLDVNYAIFLDLLWYFYMRVIIFVYLLPYCWFLYIADSCHKNNIQFLKISYSSISVHICLRFVLSVSHSTGLAAQGNAECRPSMLVHIHYLYINKIIQIFTSTSYDMSGQKR